MTKAFNIHATGLVLNGHGVIIRGPSGSGKSVLALSLIDFGFGFEARLVADDRIDLLPEHDGFTMSAPQTIAGLIELRGRGILERPFTAKARLELIIDLVADLERMPEAPTFTAIIEGIALPRCPLPFGPHIAMAHQLLLIRAALGQLSGNLPGERQNST